MRCWRNFIALSADKTLSALTAANALETGRFFDSLGPKPECIQFNKLMAQIVSSCVAARKVLPFVSSRACRH